VPGKETNTACRESSGGNGATKKKDGKKGGGGRPRGELGSTGLRGHTGRTRRRDGPGKYGKTPKNKTPRIVETKRSTKVVGQNSKEEKNLPVQQLNRKENEERCSGNHNLTQKIK